MTDSIVLQVGIAAGAFLSGIAFDRLTHRPSKMSNTPEQPQTALVPAPALQTAVTSSRGILQLGHPGPIADLLYRQAYIAAYDRRLRHPAWTAQHMTAENLKREPSTLPGNEGGGNRSNSAFKEDPSIMSLYQSTLQDYFKSGYDRGHMVAAADAKRSQAAMDETFFLTNIAPQVGDGFNRNYWAYLEDFCRRLTGKYDNVFVFTIPLYLPKLFPDGKYRVLYEVIGQPGRPNVSVPTNFAKVILTSKGGLPGQAGVQTSLGAFVLPNEPIPDETPLTAFQVPVEVVERASGLSLFSPGLKLASKPLCSDTICAVIVRRFDDSGKLIKGPAK